MTTLCLVLGDQLSDDLASLRHLQPSDVVLLCEVQAEATYVAHHQQKLVLVFAAMRHFAQRLRARGCHVDYVALDDPDNTGSFTTELQRAVERHQADDVVVVESGEWRVAQMMLSWATLLRRPVTILDDDRFLCTRAEFKAWAQGRKELRMEHFYRHMRRLTGFLMADGEPVGDRWNFDPDNRKALPRNHQAQPRQRFVTDDITQQVITLVEHRFADHVGRAAEFDWAVTRDDALQSLDEFVADHLPHFGDYQDAMHVHDDWVHHAILSPYLNIGLLTAREVCVAALNAWQRGRVPLNAVEGFIRQIIGWREYVRGLYWLHMPEYADSNHLHAQRALPAFFWDGQTRMRCLQHSINATLRHAYAHHIQRLMVIGNFAQLAGLAPAQVEQWYLLVYADAYEWVELPNTHGMALYADGGMLASKPYIASGAYIHRMSNYCAGCHYQVKEKSGIRACPFNYLYWHFLLQHQTPLSGNARLAMPYQLLAKMSAEQRASITADSQSFLARLDAGERL